jgi:hypothetical protein
MVVVKSIIKREDLPYEYVHYPEQYGAFTAFSKTETDCPFFCTCQKEAVENYIELRIKNKIHPNSDPLRKAVLSLFDFPIFYAKKTIKNLDRKIIKYKKGICHICNGSTPSVEYCAQMYGTRLKRQYGWYFQQSYYAIGLDPYENNFYQKSYLDH